jgi:hypothetical protein
MQMAATPASIPASETNPRHLTLTAVLTESYIKTWCLRVAPLHLLSSAGCAAIIFAFSCSEGAACERWLASAPCAQQRLIDRWPSMIRYHHAMMAYVSVPQRISGAGSTINTSARMTQSLQTDRSCSDALRSVSSKQHVLVPACTWW